MGTGPRVGMREIAGAIASQIQSDQSLVGCRLPPIRVLAHQLGVSKNTVTAAYEELQSKDLVESRGRTGLFVTIRQGPNLTDRLGVIGDGKKRVPLPQFKPLIKIGVTSQGEDKMIALSSIFIDPKILPKDRMTACFKSVLKSPGLANFSDRQGFLPLRKKIAQRLSKRGISAEPEQIVTTVGSQQALDLVCRSLGSGVIATENPAYYVGKALFQMNGMSPIGLPIEPFRGLDLGYWEKVIAANRPGLVYLTSNFQNPTGYSYSSQELTHLIDWSQKYGFGILEDDWGSDMLSYSEFKPSVRALGGDNVLYMNSFTKKLLPSLRIGYVVGNEQTVPGLVQGKRLSISAVPMLVEAALFEFLDRGYYDAHLKKLQQELDTRYQNCLNLLRTLMPEDVRWTSPGGGSLLWLECPKRVVIEVLVERLKARKVLIQPSHDAFFDKPHLHGFKIGYALPSVKEMQTGIEILSEELKKEF